MMHWAIAAVLALSPPGPGLEPPGREDIMAVPPQLRAQVHERIIGTGHSEQRRLDLLMDFVFSDRGLALVYGDGSTNTVAQAYDSGQVNCLSFSLLFVALAREAGLHADVQEIEQVLVWYKEDGIIYNSNHVNVSVRVGGELKTVDVSRTPVIARHRPKVISDERALAHFYNNRGAELMADGETDAARKHMQIAIELDDAFANSWNNFGVLNLRNGDPQAAERAYTTALRLNPVHGPALFNIVGLYRQMGAQQQLAEFQRRLEKAQLADPFHQFLLAVEYEDRSDYPRAVSHYRRAIRLHGREDLFHFGLARTYFAMGDTRRARRSLARAHALSDGSNRDLYQAKLQSLRRLVK